MWEFDRQEILGMLDTSQCREIDQTLSARESLARETSGGSGGGWGRLMSCRESNVLGGPIFYTNVGYYRVSDIAIA